MQRFNERPRREYSVPGDYQLIEKGERLWPPRVGTTTEERTLRGVLEELEEPYRSVIEMRFWGRLTYQAIAEEIGWPDRRWAAVYLRRGLRRLEALLSA